MTNEVSTPAIIFGTLPDGLLPPMVCGKNTQEVIETIVSLMSVLIAAGQRGPQGDPGPPGPVTTLLYNKTDVTLANAAQNLTFSLVTGDDANNYFWCLIDPSDSATPLSPAPTIGYFSLVSGTQWRVTFTAPMPGDGWIVRRTKIATS